MEIKLNIYNEDMKTVKKEVTANTIEIPFGIVRKFMNLFEIKNLNDTSTILNTVASSWKEVISLLDKIFPDMTEEEWDGVKTKDLIQVVAQVLKYSFSEMLNIPVDEKN